MIRTQRAVTSDVDVRTSKTNMYLLPIKASSFLDTGHFLAYTRRPPQCSKDTIYHKDTTTNTPSTPPHTRVALPANARMPSAHSRWHASPTKSCSEQPSVFVERTDDSSMPSSEMEHSATHGGHEMFKFVSCGTRYARIKRECQRVKTIPIN